MKAELSRHSSRPVAVWLLTGVAMMMVQVLLGGITRVTGSGLSITEWKPILGFLPPLNEHQWNDAFDKYKQIAQYKYLNSTFQLGDFKSIFFWEWLHRFWARLIGVVFIIPFVIFLFQGRFRKNMIRSMVILFLLGALQGLVGWIMVLSGLEDSDRVYVSHYRLAIHFMLALVLICYTFWFALALLIPDKPANTNRPLKKFTGWLIGIVALQFVYGAFMAGLKAAAFAPTWPDINGRFFPTTGKPPAVALFFDDPLMVQFIHRNLAYIILLLIVAWYIRSKKVENNVWLTKTRWLLLTLILLQVALGILAVVKSPNTTALMWLGVSHQFVAMILLLCLSFEYYVLTGKKKLLAA